MLLLHRASGPTNVVCRATSLEWARTRGEGTPELLASQSANNDTRMKTLLGAILIYWQQHQLAGVTKRRGTGNIVWRSASSALSVSGRRRLRLVPVITAIYGHCDVLQGTEGASQRPQISCSVDKKSPHDMIGKLFALENEPTLSLFNCQMPDFAHAAVFNSHHRPNESLINLHWSILTALRTSVAS